MKSIIGKKIGMTSVFDASGKQTAVTIIEAGPCIVTQKKTVETDGYNALQIAFGDKKEKHSNKPAISHFVGVFFFFVAKSNLEGIVAVRFYSFLLCNNARARFDDGYSSLLTAGIKDTGHANF